MKRLTIVMLVSLLISPLWAQEARFSVGEWYPYTSSRGGLAMDIVTEICRRAGIVASIEVIPWNRAETRVLEGKSFGTFPYSFTEGRNRSFLLSEPFISADTLIIRNASNASAPKGLAGSRIGITAGSEVIAAELRKRGAFVEETETIEMSLRKLETNRIDFIVEDRNIVRNLLRITENSDIVLCDDSLGATLPKRDYRVLVSRALPSAEALLRRFNRSLAEFIKSEEYRKTLAKYGILDAGRQSAKEGL